MVRDLLPYVSNAITTLQLGKDEEAGENAEVSWGL
jgi:hypothetical protein